MPGYDVTDAQLKYCTSERISKYRCPECNLLLREAVQPSCGHWLCQSCAVEIFKKGKPKCPRDDCQEELVPEDGWNFFPDRFVRREIFNFKVICSNHALGCSWEGTLSEFVSHLDECSFSLKALPRTELEKHVGEDDCPLSEIKCPFGIFGCPFVSLRKNIEVHLQQYAVYHAQIQAHYSAEQWKEFEGMKSMLQNQSERIATLERRPFYQFLGTRENHVPGTADLQPGHFDLNPHSGTSLALANGMHALSSKVTELDHSLDRCLSSSLDQELRLQLLERATYNGILLWKIDNFARRRREAVDRVTLSLYSTPFYTSRHGYKMCARIYLNGDGLGKGTHLSFFFVIMRGPFDTLLTWPFKQKVTLTLLNQVGKNHVMDHFLDPRLTQKPRKEMNVASGCPMIEMEHFQSELDLQVDRRLEREEERTVGSSSLFFPLQYISNFVVDNSLALLLQFSQPVVEEKEQDTQSDMMTGSLTHAVQCMRERALDHERRATAIQKQLN